MDFRQALEFEEKWKDRLGGDLAAGLREVMCYAATRLMVGLGCDRADLVEYLREGLELVDDNQPKIGGQA